MRAVLALSSLPWLTRLPPLSQAMAILLNLAISTQQVATGGSTYAINSEVSSMRLRAKTQSVGLVVNYLLGMVFVFVVPYMCRWNRVSS